MVQLLKVSRLLRGFWGDRASRTVRWSREMTVAEILGCASVTNKRKQFGFYGTPERVVELLCEVKRLLGKDAFVSVVYPITSRYDVPLMAAGGYVDHGAAS
jgi:hypothetical protein